MPDTRRYQGVGCRNLWVIVFVLLSIISSLRKASAWSPAVASCYCRHCHHRRSSRSRSRTTFALVSAHPDDESNSEEESMNEMSSTVELRKALDNLSNVPTNKNSSPDPSVAYSLPDLEAMLDHESNKSANVLPTEYPVYPGRVTTDEDTAEDDSDDNDGWFLNEDDYLYSSQHLNPDGSLMMNTLGDSATRVDDKDDYYRALSENLLQMQNPPVPSSNLREEPTLEDLLRMKPPSINDTSEELHAQVFKEEQGYLNQSQLFRQSLGTDGSSIAQALQWKRSSEYRKRQDAAIARLNQEIDDFEAHILQETDSSNNNRPPGERCFQCGCALSQEELLYNRHQPPTRRMCSVCLGERLASKSDINTFRDDRYVRAWPPPNSPGRRPVMHRQLSSPLPTIRKSTRPPQQKQHQSPPPPPEVRNNNVQEDFDSSTTADKDADEVERLKRELKAMQEELNRVKHATTEEPSASPKDDTEHQWTKVSDPDTGEIFYWNEETEEMKWEL